MPSVSRLLALFLLVSTARIALAADAGANTADRPNVVMILGDDQAWTDFGFMGHPVIETPNLDRLASQSLTFTRGYVPNSLCRPSLATIISGLYPHQHKITWNDPKPAPKGTKAQTPRDHLLKHIQAIPSLPRILGEHGYVSLQTGKWWEGAPALGGFTEGMTHGDPSRGGRHGDLGLKIGRDTMEPIYDFIERAGDKPFFVWYAPFLPHEPHTPPERLLAKYQSKTDSLHIAKYWAMCEWFDETCGQLMAFLDKKGLAENTMVLFVTDNGWIQQPDGKGFAPRSKRSPYDGGLRTPIMVRWPRKTEPRRDESTPVSSADLAPTVLKACGLAPAPEMQGIDLLDSEALRRRKAIFGSVHAHDAEDYMQPASNLLYRWGVDGWWKLILPNAQLLPDEKPELYDLQNDPLEKTNLAAERPEQVEKLRAEIDAWWPGR